MLNRNIVKMSNKIVQYLAVFFGSLNLITYGMEFGWSSQSLPQLQNPNDTNVNLYLTSSEGFWVAAGPLLGIIVGSPLGGMTVNVIGRRKLIMLSSVPYIISWITIAFSNNFIVLFFGRFISDISNGCIATSLTIYIAEIAVPKLRGLLGSSIPTGLILGILIVNIFGAYFSVTGTALIATVFPITSFLGMMFMPESPYFLILKKRTDEARTVLRILRHSLDVEEELKRIKDGVELQMNDSKGAFRDIFMIASNRKALLIMMLLRNAQQFSGITALIFYFTTILSESGAHFSVAVSTIIFFASQVVMSVFGSVSIDWTGRRILLLRSTIGSAIALFVEGLYFHFYKNGTDLSSWSFVPITALVIYVIFYGVGLQNIPPVIISELFPTNIKAFTVSFSDLYFGITATIVSKYFQTVDTDIGAFFAFYSFSASCIINFFLIYFFVPETKGLTLEDIQDLLKKGKIYKNDDVERRTCF